MSLRGFLRASMAGSKPFLRCVRRELACCLQHAGFESVNCITLQCDLPTFGLSASLWEPLKDSRELQLRSSRAPQVREE